MTTKWWPATVGAVLLTWFGARPAPAEPALEGLAVDREWRVLVVPADGRVVTFETNAPSQSANHYSRPDPRFDDPRFDPPTCYLVFYNKICLCVKVHNHRIHPYALSRHTPRECSHHTRYPSTVRGKKRLSEFVYVTKAE